MIVISEVIRNARRILKDDSIAEQDPIWPDEELLEIVRHGLEEIRADSDYLQKGSFVKLEEGRSVYDLSSFVHTLKRVEYQTEILDLVPRARMLELYGRNWNTKTGRPIAAIFDEQNMGVYTIYPIPLELTTFPITINFNSPYGGIDSLTFGNIALDQVVYTQDTSAFGLLDITVTNSIYVVYNQAIPDIDIDTTISINRGFKQGLEYYIAGHALIQNKQQRDLEVSTYYIETAKQKFEQMYKAQQNAFLTSNQGSRVSYDGFGIR